MNTSMERRRFTGEFYTPIRFVELAHKYAAKHWGNLDQYSFYDPASGTGNLIFPLTKYDKVFMSTLEPDDINYINSSNVFPGATAWQEDFLNTLKVKADLAMALKDKSRKWIFIMNPPFAAGTDMSSLAGVGKEKTGVATNDIRDIMATKTLGHAIQDTQSQFLYKLVHMINHYDLDVRIVQFGSVKLLNSPGYHSFREMINKHITCVDGFMFPSWTFDGTAGKWPVLCSMWERVPVCK